MELLLTIICISALIGFVIGVASGYMLATLGTTNQETGVFSDKMDRAVETEEFSRTVEFSHLEKSSSSSHSSSARVTGDTFLTPMAQSIIPEGIVGNSKRREVWESFYLVWSAGMTNHQRSMKIVSRKRKWVPQDVAQVSGFFTSKGGVELYSWYLGSFYSGLRCSELIWVFT